MKKILPLRILLMLTVISACSKNIDLADFDKKDRSSEVALNYYGTLSINGKDYNNAKLKVTRKGINEVIFEAIDNHNEPLFAAIPFSNFLYVGAQQAYISNGESKALGFYYEGDGSISTQLSCSNNGNTILFEGTNLN